MTKPNPRLDYASPKDHRMSRNELVNAVYIQIVDFLGGRGQLTSLHNPLLFVLNDLIRSTFHPGTPIQVVIEKTDDLINFTVSSSMPLVRFEECKLKMSRIASEKGVVLEATLEHSKSIFKGQYRLPQL